MNSQNVLIRSDDCELLTRYQESKPWNDADESDRDAIKEIRNRLKAIAEEAVRRFTGTTKTTEFASHPTPNGRTPKELWCCIYPKAVPNKSYGLQVALIVWGPGIEICFCFGSGTGQINNADARNKSGMALAQLKMGLQRLPLELRRDLGNAVSQNWSLRKRWKLGPGDSDFETFDQWLQFAATSEGGACISKYWLPEQLTDDVDIAEEFYSACSFFQPLSGLWRIKPRSDFGYVLCFDASRLGRFPCSDSSSTPVEMIHPNKKQLIFTAMGKPQTR